MAGLRGMGESQWTAGVGGYEGERDEEIGWKMGLLRTGLVDHGQTEDFIS